MANKRGVGELVGKCPFQRLISRAWGHNKATAQWQQQCSRTSSSRTRCAKACTGSSAKGRRGGRAKACRGGRAKGRRGGRAKACCCACCSKGWSARGRAKATAAQRRGGSARGKAAAAICAEGGRGTKSCALQIRHSSRPSSTQGCTGVCTESLLWWLPEQDKTGFRGRGTEGSSTKAPRSGSGASTEASPKPSTKPKTSSGRPCRLGC